MKLSIAQIVLGIIISIMGIKVFLLPLGLAFLVLGLAVLGVGVAQFVKARRAWGKKTILVSFPQVSEGSEPYAGYGNQ